MKEAIIDRVAKRLARQRERGERPRREPRDPNRKTGRQPEIVKLFNAERARLGHPPLAVDKRLAAAALAQAECLSDEAGAGFDHTCGGVTSAERRERAGFPQDRLQGEIICWGEKTAADALASWMGSPVHRQMILDGRYRLVGVVGPMTGATRWGVWVAELGA